MSEIDYGKLTSEEAVKLSTCNRSGHCCMFGSGYVLTSEIPGIAEKMKMTPDAFKEKFLEKSHFPAAMKLKTDKQPGKPYGSCVLLDKKEMACTIHTFKPLHCRIGTCNEHGTDLSKWYHDRYLKNNDVKKYGMVIENGRKD